MTQDEIICMAREAGLLDYTKIMVVEIERFAALVAAHEREVWSYCPECGSFDVRYEEGSHKQCAICFQEWFSDIDYSDVVQQNLNRLYAAPVSIEAAVLAEREACAKVCDLDQDGFKPAMTQTQCAAAIRARSEK